MRRPGGLAALLLVAASSTGCEARREGDVAPAAASERQARVAARGAAVMPFDLERTTHLFQPLADGGVQTVTADDPGDAEQIRLIRIHLREEAGRFKRGDFADPARIHGDDMPGLRELRDGARRIHVRYEPLPEGGRIRYLAPDPELVRAIHVWFAAQRLDHGVHMDH